MSQPFRILSFSGGGARALFQAHFLDSVSRDPTVGEFWKGYDFILGSSAGSLVAAGLCHGLSPAEIASLISEETPKAFPQKLRAAFLRVLARMQWLPSRNPGFHSRPLKTLLTSVFGAQSLGAFTKPMLAITATALADSTVRVFTPLHDTASDPVKDGDIPLVDVLMASTALPGALRAWQVPDFKAGHYIDGGMWANTPLLAGVALAAQAGKKDIRAVSIGSAAVNYSCTADVHNHLKLESRAFYEHLFKIAFCASEDTARQAVRRLIGDQNVLFIDASPAKEIPSWDVRTSIKELPNLARQRAQQALASGELAPFV